MPCQTEGGHADFAPTSELEVDLYHFLKRRLVDGARELRARALRARARQRVRFFVERDGEESAKCERARRTAIATRRSPRWASPERAAPPARPIDLFARVYGSEAGNLVLEGSRAGRRLPVAGASPTTSSRSEKDDLSRGSARQRAVSSQLVERGAGHHRQGQSRRPGRRGVPSRPPRGRSKQPSAPSGLGEEEMPREYDPKLVEKAVQTIQMLVGRRRREGEQRPPGHADGARRRSRSRSGRGTSATTRRDPRWPDRDRFVLSCGHASMLLYSMLHLVGLRPAARRAQALPPVGLEDAGPPRGRTSRRASSRRPGRSGRASPTRSASPRASRCSAARFNDARPDLHGARLRHLPPTAT